ncbi:hypothetical protein GCM10023331_40780 [Algivirga pacifica]|uniref:Lipid/polyisoprenoid-binding YceI-like domain-containing protein n=2 Tax=Algivirga pacifica TaxID=1162670 RepID=A0ABP9DSM0_9BACT
MTLFTVSIFIAGNLYAQNSKDLSGTGMVKILGTSTLHDWEAESKDIKITGTATTGEGGEVTAIENMRVVVPVKTLKSGKGGLDSNMYDALKEPKNPEIIFEVTESTPLDGSSVEVSGNLTIAGVTKPVKLTAQKSGSTYKGSMKTKMTNFGIDPPKALMGTVKSGDEITLEYEATLK